MFANRFTFLHPGRVLAAAIGSPGGWPIAPVAVYHDHQLRYPIGIADVEELIGRPVDLAELRKVPLLIFMGDQDENDSVDYQDGYEKQDRKLIDRLFGSYPVERWEDAEILYQSAGLRAEFKLFPGIAHTMSPSMIRDVTQFLTQQLKRQKKKGQAVSQVAGTPGSPSSRTYSLGVFDHSSGKDQVRSSGRDPDHEILRRECHMVRSHGYSE